MQQIDQRLDQRGIGGGGRASGEAGHVRLDDDARRAGDNVPEPSAIQCCREPFGRRQAWVVNDGDGVCQCGRSSLLV